MTASRAGFAIGRRWLQCGQAVVVIALAASAVILAVTSYQRWVSRPDQHRRDVVQVAAEVSTAAGLLTTITNGNRDEYLKRLRPHVTDVVLQALKGNTVGVPTGAIFEVRDGSDQRFTIHGRCDYERVAEPASPWHSFDRVQEVRALFSDPLDHFVWRRLLHPFEPAHNPLGGVAISPSPDSGVGDESFPLRVMHRHQRR